MKNNQQDEFDPEACVLAHVIVYMNDSDERSRERLILHLVHRYFPTGTFQPRRITAYPEVKKIFEEKK